MPLRRQAETFEMSFGGVNRCYAVSLGFYEDGARGEVFISGGKSGEAVEAIARDGAVLLSLALQYGAQIENMASAITRDGQGQPSTIIGAVIDRLLPAARATND
ncbi:TSCPD domain-containing protein [Bradyrhizobium barranii]